MVPKGTLYLVAGGIALACIYFFSFLPLTPLRPEEASRLGLEAFTAAGFFLLALVGYLRKGGWREDVFEHWLVLSLLVGLAGQLALTPFSDQSPATAFAAAHVLGAASYSFVLVGLTLSLNAVFRDEIKNRAYLDAIVSNAPDAIFSLDESGTLLSFNQGGEKMFGRVAEEVIGENIRLLMPSFPSEDNLHAEAGVSGFLGDLAKTGAVEASHEAKGKRRDGTTFPVGLTINEMWIKGRVLFVGVARDITERKRMETKLREGDRQLQGILDSAPLCISLKDIGGRYKWVNRRQQEIFGINAKAWRGKTIREVYPELGDWAEQSERIALATLDVPEGNEVVIKVKGVSRTFLQTSFVLKDVGGWPAEICSIASDITERKQMERVLALHAGETQRITRQLVESEKRLQVVLDTAATGIITFDGDGVIESFNPAAEQIFGYAAEKIIGQNFLVLMPLADCEEYIGYLDRHRGAKENRVLSRGWEARGRRQDDTEFPMHLALSLAVLETDGKAIFTAIVTDITKRQRAEQALRAAKETAEIATRTKSEFLAVMSHEIRTPMNGVIGMSGLLLETKLDDEQRQYAETIRQSADSLLTIINDILDFSKLEAGKLALEVIDFDLVELVEDVGELLGLQATGKGIDFLTFFAPDVPSHVRGDQARLRQVLMNLVGNAIKFTAGGSVAVSISLLSDTKKKFCLRFEVTDTGIGIQRKAQDQLFQRFTQADSSTTRRYGGTGLGLAICKQLVTLMNGRIGVDSAPGDGSTFWFEIQVGHPKKRRRSLVLPLESLSNLRVLVVDDSKLNRRILQKQFESWGMQVVCVESGKAALNILADAEQRKPAFDIAILDHMMPGMDGEELGRRIRKCGELAGMKLALATSAGLRKETAHFRSIGFDVCLTKPVFQSLLFDTIAHLCGRAISEGCAAADVSDKERAQAKAPSPSRSLRILLAEDNQVNQLLASVMLQRKGHRVDAVGNGIEAVKAVQSIPYDLVLMDVQMPEMDGLEATAKIRSLPGDLARIPIIALTANAMKGDREKYLAAGMNDYISKPIDEAKLHGALARWSGAPGKKSGDALAARKTGSA
ncbi:MAG: PAS domain S-box protein [Pseudomonadota bacterium]